MYISLFSNLLLDMDEGVTEEVGISAAVLSQSVSEQAVVRDIYFYWTFSPVRRRETRFDVRLWLNVYVRLR